MAMATRRVHDKRDRTKGRQTKGRSDKGERTEDTVQGKLETRGRETGVVTLVSRGDISQIKCLEGV
jgi:hypothetical protein